jgi:hypothetical protein
MKRRVPFLLRAGLWVIVGTVLTGCTHTVNYKLAEKDKWDGPKIDKTLRVDTLAESEAVYAERKLELDGKVCRTNYRKGYKDGQIATAISDMIARHLAHSGVFKSVVRNNSEPADWVLSGTIKEYKAAASINSTAEGVQAGTTGFGLIGAIIGSASTAGMKTAVKASVEVSPLTLTDGSGKVLWQTNLGANTNFVAHFSASDERAVFHHADQLLKEAVSGLIQNLGKQEFESGSKAAAR